MDRLILKDITKIYKKKVILNNINLEFNSGKCYMLIGENGSGKSTILKLITKLIFPNSGDISYGNLVISYVPEKLHLPLNVKTMDFLEILQRIKKAKIEKVLELIEYFGMTNAKEKKLKELSKGMLQKILIIQSLMVDADVYVFDEVLNGLDVNNQNKFLDYLKVLKDNNKLIIITSHYSDYYKKIVDEIIDMKMVNKND